MIKHAFFILSLTALFSSCQSEPKPAKPIEPLPALDVVSNIVCLDTSQLDLRKSTPRLVENTWYVQTMKRTIPVPMMPVMIMYHSKDCAEEYISLDSISFNGREYQQLIKVENYFSEEIKMITLPEINFDDYNFDGVADLRIYSSLSEQKNRYYAYYLYNSRSHQFEYSERLSEKSNLSIDREKKTLKSFHFQDDSGNIFEASEYQFTQNELKEISRRQQVFLSGIGYMHDQYELKEGLMTLTARDTVISN